MSGQPQKLRELAKIVRSKNAGPFRLTFDILFADRKAFEVVRDAKAITREAVARAYKIREDQVSSIYEIPTGNAFKVTLHRPVVQGAMGETDVYGCQQHVPLLDLPVARG
ncbi:DUF4387 domain-containing protein [Limibacillus sp. MBR-115]|jgi:hypothetical protein|uniref:DUF4387 domain-containing protein n=1 Tax=Limibacillus sp. MBR-115 TaxID=3156465 RepID=UPI003395A2D3